MLNEPDKEPGIKGVYLKDHMDQLEKIAGKEVADGLRKTIGYTSAQRIYPIKNHLKVLTAIASYQFHSGEVDEKVGEYIANLFFQSFIGKTLLSLFGKNPYNILEKIPYFFTLALENMKIEISQTKECSADAIIHNCAYPPKYMLGFFQAGIKFLNKKPAITWEEVSPKEIKYHLNWS